MGGRTEKADTLLSASSTAATVKEVNFMVVNNRLGSTSMFNVPMASKEQIIKVNVRFDGHQVEVLEEVFAAGNSSTRHQDRQVTL
jgi:hypothetical protein